MTEVVLFVGAAVVIVVSVLATIVEIARDGRGSVPPPRSHPADVFEVAARRGAGPARSSSR